MMQSLSRIAGASVVHNLITDVETRDQSELAVLVAKYLESSSIRKDTIENVYT
jgi:hypothetical protein